MEASSLIVGIPEDYHAIGLKESLTYMKIQLALHGLNELQNYTGGSELHPRNCDSLVWCNSGLRAQEGTMNLTFHFPTICMTQYHSLFHSLLKSDVTDSA